MMQRRLARAFLVAACLAPLGCGGPSGQQTSAAAPANKPAVREVTIDNFAYSPQTLTVPRGTRVTWVNHDDVPHTVTSSAKPRAFASQALDTDDRFEHVFTKPGVYEYFCAVHPKMTAKVVVE